ncbi:NAD-dependent epimerase/dehydratase family protein [Paenibacillus silvisoli]|uniref:NAD-dependent epimerase/dehydratase family protein n=1 Tax=Paenibacillus silvisoli TaxID=3110539 RepID=UPI0028038CA1|nr:NAD(P)-dependent oxidoreductase [Paenibacillus silvisoli]
MKTIAVTGASGKLGGWVVGELLNQGYTVIALDNRRSDKLRCRQITVDLGNLGQVIGGVNGADAIIHLAAIPAPGSFPNEFVFSNNVQSTYNVLEAASVLGIRKVVHGSSESSYGFAWAPRKFDPDYFPVDEAHPQLPQECYGLSKIVNEQTGDMFHRRTGMEVAAMRYSLIATPDELRAFGERIRKPESFKKILWSYVDIRDAVSATLSALTTDGYGSVSLNITSSDTLSDWETERLLREFYPEVRDLRRSFAGREAIVSNEAACRVLNWKPEYSWQDSQ